MALGNLGDLEEISQSPGRPPPLTLFQESIDADKRYYDNQHVYPYTYMGAFLFRNGQYKAALSCWSNASAVMKGYKIIFHFIILSSKLIYYAVAFFFSSVLYFLFLSEKFFKNIGQCTLF